MKKNERDEVCALIARWEWQENGSSSEATARGNCARSLREALGITDADLSFSRGWEIYRLASPLTDDDDLMDAIVSYIEDHGNEAVIDIIDRDGIPAFAQRAKDRFVIGT